MKLKLSIAVVLLVLGTVKCFSKSRVWNSKRIVSSETLVLAQNWPISACLTLNGNGAQGACNKVPRHGNQWTLHGFWPNRKSNSACDKSKKFKIADLSQDLQAEMAAKMPSFNLKWSNKNFWAHEYNKHGICAADMPETNSAEKYFRKSLEMLEKYNVGMLLERAGIVPGRSYEFDEIKRGMDSVLGVNIKYDCKSKSGSDDIFLVQVLMCFDMNYGLVDCLKGSSKSRCNGSGSVAYI